MPKRLIKLYSHVGDLILDPFAGILSTSFAAAQSGRNSIAVEANKKYCDSGYRKFRKSFVNEIFGEIEMEKV